MPEEAQAQSETQGQGETPNFDTWLGSQDETVRGLLDGHTQGLKSALESERDQRKTLAKQIKDMTGKLDASSDAAKQLSEISGKLEQTERRAAFFEDAAKPEIGCSNPRAAFLVASAEGLFHKSGEPNWQAIKAEAPELFAGRKTAAGNAGTGTNSPPAAVGGMNEFIRTAAGRG